MESCTRSGFSKKRDCANKIFQPDKTFDLLRGHFFLYALHHPMRHHTPFAIHQLFYTAQQYAQVVCKCDNWDIGDFEPRTILLRLNFVRLLKPHIAINLNWDHFFKSPSIGYRPDFFRNLWWGNCAKWVTKERSQPVYQHLTLELKYQINGATSSHLSPSSANVGHRLRDFHPQFVPTDTHVSSFSKDFSHLHRHFYNL